jgi:hypothetical protein
MGASSNFGNMFKRLRTSAFLPSLPMALTQVLTNNLLYDFSQVSIPADVVYKGQVTWPRPWNIAEIKRLTLFIGPIGSVFDHPLASALGFTHLPRMYWPIPFLELLVYVDLRRSSSCGCGESNGSKPAFLATAGRTRRPQECL